MKLLWFTFAVFTMLFISSCAHLNSGQYIQVRKGESLKSLSNEFKIPAWRIQAANEGKKFKAGEWVFIPMDKGIWGRTRYRQVASSDYIGNGDFLWPVPARKKISSGYGHRWGRKHEGIDIPAPVGSHILSVADGIVVYSGNDLGGYGNLTVISHGGGIFSVYAHAKVLFTKKGDRVHQGQVIAQVGMTGRTSGPHLHFELRHNSRPLDPSKMLTQK
ncbi:MAG: hypothetical protein CME70_20140 [Halobacteriovorax sp.]|nr:hypothetical protein [Halobacteriovorax sp.]